MREQIIKAATDQIKKYGFRRFTIEDIASDLGISKKTIYKYFEGKDQIISAVCSTHMKMKKERVLMVLATGGTWFDKMMGLVCTDSKRDEADVQLVLELKRYFPEEWKKQEVMSACLAEYMKDFLRQGIISGDIRPDIDIDVLWTIINGSFEALCDAEFNELSPKQVLTAMSKVFLHGILTPESKMRGACESEE